jgi:hypothetical protein
MAIVLMFTGMQLLRAWVGFTQWNFILTLPLSVSPLFFVLSGLVWGFLGLWLAFGLRRGSPWARKATMVSALLFAAFAWFDRLVLQAEGPQTTNRPFEIGLTVVLVGVVYAALTLPEARHFFGRNYEQ